MDAGLFLDDFEAEARAHIECIETAFLDAEALAGDQAMMNRVFRAAHSLKGAAGFFSFHKIISIAHELESVFTLIKDKSLTLDDEIVEAALQSVDCLKALMDSLPSEEAVPVDALLQTLGRYTSGMRPEEAVPEAYEIPFDLADPGLRSALKAAARRGHKAYCVTIQFNRSLGRHFTHPESLIDSFLSIGSIHEAIIGSDPGEKLRDADPGPVGPRIIEALAERDTSTLELLVTSVLEPDLFAIATEISKKYIHMVPKEHIAGAGRAEPGNAPPRAPEGTGASAPQPQPEAEHGAKPAPAKERNFSIRLDMSSINALMDLANEMILSRNQLLSAVSGHVKSIAGIAPILHDLNRLTSEIQEKVMLTRMQPISVIFGKFPRIIHDTAKALQKDIEIELNGNGVMLDKYLLDSLTDPITQLVKNAADHGLEPAERRAALGKPPKGKITLNAYMRDGSAIIEVADDGAGIDVEALKRKSMERGIAVEESLPAMQGADAFSLVFEPGISTAKKVTELSGRGVGMDIVKTNIEKLGGTIDIESEADKGTVVRLNMPPTLSVIRTLIVTINGIPYAVPEINVERIVRIWAASPARRLERINKSLVLSLNGRIIPVVTIEEIEARATGGKRPSAAAPLAKISRRDVVKCLVLKAGSRAFALLIDDAVSSEETLVKPLPVYLQSCPCYSNVTVLGNGSAIMILDAEGIMRFMDIEAIERISPPEEAGGDMAEKKQVILFTCSGTEYFALETGEISRIEAIRQDSIQEIGHGAYVNIAEQTIRVVRPEDFAPVAKRAYAKEKLYVLLLKKSATPIGLLAGKVIDKVEDAFPLSHDQLLSDFVVGTSVFDEKILIFLNPGAIVEEVERDKQRKKNVKRHGKEALPCDT